MIQVGQPAPDFTLPGDDEKPVNLKSLRGKNVVLFWYPKADTSGCTIEACEFRDALPRFDGLNAVILGASADPVSAQAKFKAKFEMPYTLLSDVDHKTAEEYGVWQKKYMGIARMTFVIDKTGNIAHVFAKVKPEGHAAEVAKVVEQLG
jgi:peroxiredoxin Q/BCP